MKTFSLSLVLLILLASAVSAGVPDKFTNLKVLPENIGKRELIQTMQGFSDALGMNCTDCHEMKTPGDFSSIDWASEKLHNKEVARGMMKMVQEINANLLPAATGEDDFAVRCITCHRGVEVPRTLDNVLLKTIAKDGAGAAADQYRDLREIYYGSGSYNFSPVTLTTVAQDLAQTKDDVAGARLMVELNIEMNPDHAESYLLLAQMDISSGDKESARNNIDKALEIDPNSRQAKRLLNQMGQ